jgi:hypothetical protein
VFAEAACVGFEPAFWDTNTRDGVTARTGTVRVGQSYIPRQEQIAFAKTICESCPVITLCLFVGMTEKEGIWGGKLPDER